MIQDIIEIVKSWLCNHKYISKDICKNSLHTQLVCEKCGKNKYKFEG